jgi:hypothetical protein
MPVKGGLSVLVSVLLAAALLAVIVLAFVTDVLAAWERVRVERVDRGAPAGGAPRQGRRAPRSGPPR